MFGDFCSGKDFIVLWLRKCFTNLKLADSWFVFCSLFLISVEMEVLQNVD